MKSGSVPVMPQRNCAVAVDVPPARFDPVTGRDCFHELFDALEVAERVGTGGVGVTLHPITAYGLRRRAGSGEAG